MAVPWSATAVGGLVDAVEHEATGLLVPSGDVRELRGRARPPPRRTTSCGPRSAGAGVSASLPVASWSGFAASMGEVYREVRDGHE